MRYGDDFLVIAKTHEQATDLQLKGTEFLNTNLHLYLHASNNVVVKIRHGIKYLGVIIYPYESTLSAKDFKIIQDKLHPKNYESYNSHVKNYGSSRQIAEIDSFVTQIFLP